MGDNEEAASTSGPQVPQTGAGIIFRTRPSGALTGRVRTSWWWRWGRAHRAGRFGSFSRSCPGPGVGEMPDRVAKACLVSTLNASVRCYTPPWCSDSNDAPIRSGIIMREESKAMATKRKVFYSFHFDQDSWRTAEVRNMGVLEGNQPASDNDWENIKRGGDPAIKRWIDDQLDGKTCTVVLIGQKTAGRKWIKYEIERSWELNKGLVGIYIHNLKDQNSNQSKRGRNPFDIRIDQRNLSNIVKSYDPPYKTSDVVYNHIKTNIADWIEEAIKIRKQA